MAENRRGVQEGMTVHSADGEKLGNVVQCQIETFVIGKGAFFPEDYVARYDDVADVAGHEIRLVLVVDDASGTDEAGGTEATATSSAAGERARKPSLKERLPRLKEKIKEKLTGRGEQRAASERDDGGGSKHDVGDEQDQAARRGEPEGEGR